MQLRPLFLVRNHHHDDSPALATTDVDYRVYTDDQLIAERDHRQRRLEELTRRRDHTTAICSQLVTLDGEVERMTDELIRRARSRHPSSHGLTG